MGLFSRRDLWLRSIRSATFVIKNSLVAAGKLTSTRNRFPHHGPLNASRKTEDGRWDLIGGTLLGFDLGKLFFQLLQVGGEACYLRLDSLGFAPQLLDFVLRTGCVLSGGKTCKQERSGETREQERFHWCASARRELQWGNIAEFSWSLLSYSLLLRTKYWVLGTLT